MSLTKLLATDGQGERLGRFELIAEIASGGMATVFLARLSGVAGFSRLVAIKRLHPHLARESEFVDMFLDEARLAARIHHPNVVPIQEVGQSESGYYLVMDYVEGDTLARMIARAAQAGQAVPHGVIVRVLLDVLAGLHAAHELKDDNGQPLAIVHRDVSPQNILVGVDGVARVVDFGVAKAASRLTTTRSGQLKGKLGYMAPEQARGVPLDRRADLFACGIVLWEALAVKRLFKGEGEAETLRRVLYDEIPLPTAFRPDVPRALEEVCMRALSREPEGRFDTAHDMADALERAARELSCIGSVRDVTACLEQAVGADLSQQREAVRAWLARSEPSGVTSAPLSVPRPAESQTKIEVPGRGSSPDRTGSGMRAAGSLPPEKLSSVASAAVFSDMSATHAPPSKKARVLAALAGVVGAVVLVGLGFAARGTPQGAAVAAGRASASASAPTSAVPTPPAPATVAPVVAPVASAPEPVVTPVASVAPAAGTGTKRNGGSKPVRAPTTSTAKGTTAVPDDLSNNPYR